jgi:hypothetical protein
MNVDVDCGADDIDKQADPVNALAPQTPTSSLGMIVPVSVTSLTNKPSKLVF